MNSGVLTLLGVFAAAGPVPSGPVPTPGMAPPGGTAMAMPHTGGGTPTLQPELILPMPAPVLAAKVFAPPGVRVAVHPKSPLVQLSATPAVFGFRPGYVYRLELSNLPLQPGRVLYPEVEVRGVLVPRPGMKYMDWPAPLLFTAQDIERALAGGLVTKVVYLEDPEKAIPAELGPNTPFEVSVGSEVEAVKAADAGGRMVAIVRLGSRIPSPAWLAATAIDGTILLPGEKYLRTPLVPPTISYYTCKLYDPIYGPRPGNQECFLDGGDRGDPLGIGPNGRLGGLNPTDVGVEYTVNGQRKVTTSNVVCLCVPRFVIQRADVAPIGINVPVGVVSSVGSVGVLATSERQAAMAEIARERPVAVAARVRTMAFIGKVGSTFFVGSERPVVIGQVEGVKVVGALVEPEQLTAYPSLCPLTVTKSVDPAGMVQSGDVVTFTIKYVNTGNRTISDIAVSDSLSGRLEFIPGSAQSDRASNFAAGDNEVGSVVVRWELPGVLLPGQGGVVKFKAKVR